MTKGDRDGIYKGLFGFHIGATFRIGWNILSCDDGEYVLYYRGKVIGGIYDDRFLVKPIKSAKAMMPDADMELPYEGAKEMILVDDVENKEFLRNLFESVYEELPEPKRKKKWSERQKRRILILSKI